MSHLINKCSVKGMEVELPAFFDRPTETDTRVHRKVSLPITGKKLEGLIFTYSPTLA